MNCNDTEYEDWYNTTYITTIINMIAEGVVVTMTVNGQTNDYTPERDVLGWDMRCINDTAHTNAWYGISCDSVEELKSLLLDDYNIGILTYVALR